MNLRSPQEEEEEGLTHQQLARVSEKFRAANALLARKRPRLSPSFTLENGKRSNDRVPLSEISTNTPSTFPVKPYSTPTTFIIQKHHHHTQFNGTTSYYSEEPEPQPEFNTPVAHKLPQPQCPVTNSPSSAPTLNPVLDDDDEDDFDDLILEEIDALCKQQRSDVAAAPQPQSTSPDETVTSVPEQYSTYLDSLNELQREAASAHISTPLMILAGPGSGKTSTMVGRILFLLNKGISPSNILAMTFTTAATSEMRERVGAIAGKDTAKQLLISTFHSFSLQLCRSHADKLERTSEFLVFGQGQQRRAVIEAVRLLENENNKKDLHLHKLVKDSGDTDMTSPANFKDKSHKWQKFVTQAKASGKTPQDFSNLGKDIGAAILRHYNDILKSCNALDYHDLISCSVRLLTDFPEVLRECQDSWKAIIVDEFQDTSAMQYCLLRILASHNCITIIGDDDQSIFSFNGANICGFDSFREDFLNYKEIRLVKNYRSTRCIVEAASSLIQNNTRRCQYKNFLTDNSSGSKITIKECHNENAQCTFVIDKIQEITSNCSDAKFSYGDIAILYRRQVSGKVFQDAFRDRKIPFNIHGVAFYRKKVVRAIIAMLKTTLPGCDDIPYRQVFKAWLPFDKEEKKRVVNHIDKVSAVRKCSFILAASDVFTAKVSEANFLKDAKCCSH